MIHSAVISVPLATSYQVVKPSIFHKEGEEEEEEVGGDEEDEEEGGGRKERKDRVELPFLTGMSLV